MSKIIEAVRHLLEEQHLLCKESRLLCAVSGGADSMALLGTLFALSEECGFSLTALHIQHGLRGEDSLADEAFVREWCRQRSLPLLMRNAGLTGSMDTPGMEKLARNARLRIFSEELQNADALLLAHHLDDQAETVLMHLLRGAGSEGLGGMKPVSLLGGKRVLRPFLSISKAELLAYLEEQGIPHREDLSNFEPTNPRNRLRLSLMPQLEALFPNAGKHIAECAEILRLESEELSAQAEQAYSEALLHEAGLHALQRSKLEKLPEAVLRRLLRKWIREGYQRIHAPEDEQTADYEETAALVRLIRTGERGSVNLSHGCVVKQGKYLLILYPTDEPENLPPVSWNTLRRIGVGHSSAPKPECSSQFPPEGFAWPEPDEAGTFHYAGFSWKVSFCQGGEIPQNALCIVLPNAFRQAVLRLPESGDVIQAFGSSGHKPYRRFLTDIRLDEALRRRLPVLALGHEILWVPSLCASEALRTQGAHPNEMMITVSGGLAQILSNAKE